MRDQPIPVKERSPATMRAYKKISQFQMQAKLVHDPCLARKVRRIIILNRILLPVDEVERCIRSFYTSTKGDGARKLKSRISAHYFGIGETKIQKFINGLDIQRQRHTRFDNKAPLKPVDATLVMERHQVDIVDLRNIPVVIGGVRYRYVLSVLDVFSRFLWLRSLADKNADTVARELYKIYLEFGPPKIIQTDQGGEFKGVVKTLCKLIKTKLIYSRSNHPQSQGKDERSHSTWKEKIRHDLFSSQTDHCNWVDRLPILQRIYNEGRHRITGVSPYKLLFGVTSNHVLNTMTTTENTTVSDKEIDEADWIDPGTIQVSQEIIDDHVTILSTIRKHATEKAKIESQKMVSKRLTKFPPSEYNIGEEVLVKFLGKDKRVKRGGTSILAPKVLEGVVVESDKKNYRYKIELKQQTGKSVKRWIRVDNITSKRYEDEKKKKTTIRRKKVIHVPSKQTSEKDTAAKKKNGNTSQIRVNFEQIQHIIMESIQLHVEEERRTANLLRNARRRNLELHSDNEGGGDCMFHALRHQLFTHGIDIDSMMIRQQIVTFLRSNPTLTMPDGSVVNFEDFIYHRNGWNSYLNDMSRSGMWGDYLTLIAAANVFGVRIIIVSSLPGTNDVTIDPMDSMNTTEIYLGHLHELHYVSLIQTEHQPTLSAVNSFLCHVCGSVSDESHTCNPMEDQSDTMYSYPTQPEQSPRSVVDEQHKYQSVSVEDSSKIPSRDQTQSEQDMTMETVLEKIRYELEQENNTSHDMFKLENSVNLFHEFKRDGVPVCVNNARVHMFIRAMQKRSKQYKTAETIWGKFVFIPEDDMMIFENQRGEYMNPSRSFRLFDEPFRYWLSSVYIGNVTVVDTSNGTIAEMDHDIANEYDTWVEQLKFNLRNSM